MQAPLRSPTANALYLEPIGGIAGDMLVGALLDMGLPLDYLRRHLAALPVEGLRISARVEQRHAISGTRFVVELPGEEPDTGTAHGVNPDAGNQPDSYDADGHHHAHGEHGHGGHSHGEHGHGSHAHGEHSHGSHAHGEHSHHDYRAIRTMLEKSALPEGARVRALAVFAALAGAEGRVHGIAPEAVRFHEVGAWDSIADIVCAALGLDWLGLEQIVCGVVPTGSGTARTAHGVMPVPAPATLLLLEGFALQGGGPAFERTTPTGAALLAALARPAPVPPRFTPVAHQAHGVACASVGHGLGTKNPPEVANLLRATTVHMAGEGAEEAGGLWHDEVECALVNVDDSNPEWLSLAQERLLAVGALDALAVPVSMKKGRGGTQIQVLYPPGLREAVRQVLFDETTTLGIRYMRMERDMLPRRAVRVETPLGPVAGKVALWRGRERFTPEFEDCRRVAEQSGRPLREVYEAAHLAWAGAAER